jgi:hypothetical protein
MIQRKRAAQTVHGPDVALTRAELYAKQNGRCYLCGEPGDLDEMVIDHDHRCSCGPRYTCRNCRRGLAHSQCNTLIGLAGDDPEKLHRIAGNLAKAKEQHGDPAPPLTLFDPEDSP